MPSGVNRWASWVSTQVEATHTWRNVFVVNVHEVFSAVNSYCSLGHPCVGNPKPVRSLNSFASSFRTRPANPSFWCFAHVSNSGWTFRRVSHNPIGRGPGRFASVTPSRSPIGTGPKRIIVALPSENIRSQCTIKIPCKQLYWCGNSRTCGTLRERKVSRTTKARGANPRLLTRSQNFFVDHTPRSARNATGARAQPRSNPR
jgi:hypothetical protein